MPKLAGRVFQLFYNSCVVGIMNAGKRAGAARAFPIGGLLAALAA